MRNAYKIMLVSLALMLLSACTPPSPGAGPTPGVPTMPPANTDIGLPREGDDPLALWRNRGLFENTEVIVPQKAFNYPVLIAEHLALDWDALRSFAAAQVPSGVSWDEHIGSTLYIQSDEEKGFYLAPEFIGDAATRKGRPHWYTLTSDPYQTDHGRDSAAICEDVPVASYWFVKKKEHPPSAEDRETPIPYGEREAADMVRAALYDWGVPVEELELIFLAKVDPNQGTMLPQSPFNDISTSFLLQVYQPGYAAAFRHMLYDIPVYDSAYSVMNDPSDRASGRRVFRGHWAFGMINAFGLREVRLHFRRVVRVEKHDVPILPISDIIQTHYNTLWRLATTRTVARIELMLVPIDYDGADPDTQVRLTPAWCFFFEPNGGDVIIDASTGSLISPSQAEWEFRNSRQ